MPRFIKLSDTETRRLRKPGRHCIDTAAGLYLRIPVSGQPAFEARITLDGKRSWRVLGNASQMTLQAARTAALEQKLKPTEAVGSVPSFATAAAGYLERRQDGWKAGGKSLAQWQQTLDDYVLPVIGHLPLDRITADHALKILRPLWTTKRETADRVRQRIAAILQAESRRLRIHLFDPANLDDLRLNLPRTRKQVRHHPAPTIEQLQQLLVDLGDAVSHRALRLVILTACRSGEIRGLVWGEVDGDVLRLPAERMKAQRPHTVPLTRAARACLPQRPADAAAHDLALPSTMTGGQLSDMALLEVLRKRDLDYSVHGCRAAFKSWAAEAGHNHAAVELQLAHSPSKLEQAYQRSDLLEQRREIMEAWAALLIPAGSKEARP